MIPALALLSACQMVVDYGGPAPGDTGAPDPAPTSPPSTTRPTSPTPPTTTTTTPAPLPIGVIGGDGDQLGEGGLWWVPPAGSAELRLAIGVPSRGSIALFDAGAIGPATPVAAAAAELLGDEGKGGWAFAVAEEALVMGAPGEEEVWLLARDPAGRVDAEEAQLAVVELDDDGPQEETELGAAVAVGDADGDGLDDLAIGDPRGASGLGAVVRGSVDTILLAGSWRPTSAPVRLRGSGGRFGAALALGPVDGSGLDALVACAPAGGDGTCWVVPGGLDVADLDVATVASASVTGPGIGRVAPRIGDVDGDGAAELILAGDGATWVFADPAGALEPSAAIAAVEGDVGAVGLGHGGVVLGAPEADAVYRLDAPAGSLQLPSDAAHTLVGAVGTAFGAAVSDLSDEHTPGLAVAAPDALGGAGEVLLLDLSSL